MTVDDPNPTPSPPPAQEGDASRRSARRARRRARAWWVRGLRGLGFAVLALVLLVAGLLAALLYSPAFDRFAVRRGVAVYDGMIPGHVEVGEIDGYLADQLVLHDLHLTDSTGHPLIEARQVALGLDVAALMRGGVQVKGLELAGADIRLPPPNAGGFGDLAPPRTEPPPPPDADAPLGPDLPLDLGVDLHVTDLRVLAPAADPEAPPDEAWTTLLELGRLDATASAARTEAAVALQLAAEVPAAGDLSITALSVDASWNSPKLEVDELSVASSWGQVELEPSRLDFDELAGQLGELRVSADRAWFEANSGMKPTGSPTLVLDAHGSREDLELSLRAQLPGLVAATLSLDGALGETIDATLALDVVAVPNALSPGLVAEQATAGLRLRATGSTDDEIAVDGTLRCTDCDPEGDPPQLDLQATLAPEAQTVLAELGLTVAGTELHAEGGLEEGNRVHLDATLDAPDLSRVADVIGRFVPRPDLAGKAELEVSCRGVLDPRDLVCSVNGGLREGRPVRLARVDLSASLVDDELEAEVRELAVSAKGVDVHTLGKPARIEHTLGEPGIAFEDLDVSIATAKGQGRVSAEGALNPEGHSDLRVDLRNVDLAAANAFAPQLGLRGELEGRVRATGRPEALQVDADLRTGPIVMRGQRIGRLDVGVHQAEGHADARVRLRGGTAGELAVDLRAPFALDLEAGELGPSPGPWTLSLHLDDAELDELAQLSPVPLALTGHADLDLAVTGGRRPTIDLELRGRALAWDGKPVGDLRLDVGYRARAVDLALAVTHPRARSIELDAKVPLSLALPLGPPRVRWLARREHRARFAINDLDLQALDPWVPDHHFGGNLDVYLAVAGDMQAPRVDLEVGIRDARFDDKGLGTVELRSTYVDERIILAAEGHGPTFDELRIEAEAPVSLTPARRGRPFAWHEREPHRLLVGVSGVELSAIARDWVPALEPFGGRAILRLEVDGSPHAPRVAADIAVADLAREDVPVGDLSVHATLDQRIASADVLLRHDAQRSVSVFAAVPVDVDPVAGDFRWRRNDPHELHLEAQQVDAEFLAAFAEFPDPLAVDLHLMVDGQGNAQTFSVQGRLDGGLAVDGPRQPFGGTFEVHPDWQSVGLRLGGGKAGSLSLDARTEIPILGLLPPAPGATDGGAKQGPDLMAAPIQLAFGAEEVQLALFSALLPPAVHELEGAFSSDVDVKGTVGTPHFAGTATLDQGGVTVLALRQRFEGIGLDLDFDDDGARLSRFHLDAGQGSVDASGELHVVKGALLARFELEADDVPFGKPGIPRMAIDTKVAADIELDTKRTEVAVKVKKTLIDVKGTNVPAPTAIPSSGAVRYVDLAPDEVEAQLARIVTEEALRSLRPPEPAVPAPSTDGDGDENGDEATLASFSAPRETAVVVELADPVQIRGPAVDMAWDGRVEVKTGPKGVSTSGSFDAEQGAFDLLSNRFTVTRGVVTIPPGRDAVPFIDLAATTQIEQYEITATIKGRVTRPEFHLTSVPAADEATIFGMLVSGTANPDESPNAAKQAASVLAAFSNPTLQRKLNEKIGVDKVGLSFGETASQPILTVGKHLTQDVYVETEYQFGADPSDPTVNKAEVNLRYRFVPNWSLETYFGDAPAGGVGVFWGRAYGVRRKSYWIDQSALPRRRRVDVDALEASEQDVNEVLPDSDSDGAVEDVDVPEADPTSPDAGPDTEPRNER